MDDLLDLANARRKLLHARKRCNELTDVVDSQLGSGGLALICERDPTFVLYEWSVAMRPDITQDLPALAGEVFYNLRGALDYIAWQIFLAGGGTVYDRRASGVYFPIVTDVERWEETLRQKVPGAWPEAQASLRDSQPFAQSGIDIHALPALRSLGDKDKHRELSMFAVGVAGMGITIPAFPDGYTAGTIMRQPGPAVGLGERHSLVRALVRMDSDPSPPYETTLTWSAGIELERPPPPQLSLGFRSPDGSEIGLEAMTPLVIHVQKIVDRFSALHTP